MVLTRGKTHYLFDDMPHFEVCPLPMQPRLLTQVLCWLGIHDFRVISETYGFGSGGGVEKVECRRCGATMTRPMKTTR